MLVDDDAAQGFYSRRDPDGVLHGEDQFARIHRGLVANPEVGCFDHRWLVVRGLLGSGDEGKQGEQENESAHGFWEK